MPLQVRITGDVCPDCEGLIVTNGYRVWCRKCGNGLKDAD